MHLSFFNNFLIEETEFLIDLEHNALLYEFVSLIDFAYLFVAGRFGLILNVNYEKKCHFLFIVVKIHSIHMYTSIIYKMTE